MAAPVAHPAAEIPTLTATVAAGEASSPPATPTVATDPLVPTEKFDRDSMKAEVDRALTAVPKTPSSPRTEEDDRLLAALLFLVRPTGDGHSGPPSPFATVGGVSLLKRAAAACKLSNVPKVIVAGEKDPSNLAKIESELKEGGWDGSIQVWDGGGPPPVGTRGRILILDASGVHDPEAVARLARWRGERAAVMVSSEGDGLRVQVEGNKVREIGSQLVPFDGVTCGALNVPLALFPRISENGALSALISLAQDGLLGASVEHRTIAREINSETGLSEARQRLLERAAGGPHDTLVNRLVFRRIARPLTQAVLPMGVPPVALNLISVLVGLVGAALLTGGGVAPAAALVVGGIFLILASTVFDCVAYELRSFAVQPGARRTVGDVFGHGLVTAAALAGFGQGCHLLGVDGAQLNGLVAAGGAVLGALLVAFARSQGEAAEKSDPATLGIELLSRRLVNREVAWLLLLLMGVHWGLTLSRPAAPDAPPSHEVLDQGLVGLAALAQAYWVALALFLALQPRKK